MKIGSLCSGYEGLGMAVEAVFPDAELAWVSDIDKGANKVLAHRFPHVPNIGDMTTVDWTHVEPVDVITGGTPCQDLSHAGKRAGMTEGTRSNLWVSMREAIATIRPQLVVWENVGGAYSAAATSDLESREGRLGDGSGRPVLRALGRVLGDLASLGYVGGWHGLRAADVGAPHGRLRVFVVAWPAADADGRVNLARSARADQRPVPGSDGDGARPDRLLPSPRTSDTNGPGHHGDGGLDLRTAVTLLPTPTTADSKASGSAGYGGNEFCTLTDATARGKGGMTPDAEGLVYVPHIGRVSAMWGEYAAAIARWEYTLRQPAPAPTQLGRTGKPQLSPAFTEWMMGLPPGWITDVPGITRNEALKLCGNGVVPQQAAAAIRFLLANMSEVAA